MNDILTDWANIQSQHNIRSKRMSQRIPNEVAFGQLRSILNKQGMRPAIIYLNGLTQHRYTSVFVFDGPMGRHAYYYDRQNPEHVQAPDTLLHLSYCVYVKSNRALFNVADSMADERVEPHHAKRETIRSYCGVPLTDDLGNVIGSACHYNVEPMAIDPQDVELLEAFSKMVSSSIDRA